MPEIYTKKDVAECEIMDFEESGIPDRIWPGLTYWVKFGIWPGDFLSAVIVNDLRGAVGRADAQNIRLLHNYIRALYNDVPHHCWGSPEIASAWHNRFEEAKENGVDP
jgi:hypothetical protein